MCTVSHFPTYMYICMFPMSTFRLRTSLTSIVDQLLSPIIFLEAECLSPIQQVCKAGLDHFEDEDLLDLDRRCVLFHQDLCTGFRALLAVANTPFEVQGINDVDKLLNGEVGAPGGTSAIARLRPAVEAAGWFHERATEYLKLSVLIREMEDKLESHKTLVIVLSVGTPDFGMPEWCGKLTDAHEDLSRALNKVDTIVLSDFATKLWTVTAQFVRKQLELVSAGSIGEGHIDRVSKLLQVVSVSFPLEVQVPA